MVTGDTMQIPAPIRRFLCSAALVLVCIAGTAAPASAKMDNDGRPYPSLVCEAGEPLRPRTEPTPLWVWFIVGFGVVRAGTLVGSRIRRRSKPVGDLGEDEQLLGGTKGQPDER